MAAPGVWWATMTGHRFTDAGDSLSVDVVAWVTQADEGGIDTVTFTINGSPTVVSERTLRQPNYNAQPSPRTDGGQMADLAAFGVTINAADYAAGTITITAEAETVNGTTAALPGSIIIYNDKGGADTRPSPKTRYANADTGDDANDGTSSGSAVRTIQRLCEVMATSGDMGGALGICEAATAHYEAGPQTAANEDLFTTAHWWATVRFEEGAVFERTGVYDPGSNGPGVDSNSLLRLRGGDVWLHWQFAGTNGESQQVGGNPFVLTGSYDIHLWTEGGTIGNEHWTALKPYSVRNGERGWNLIVTYGTGSSVTRYVTCCTLRGIANGFVGVDFVHDCSVEYWTGWAMQTNGDNQTPCVLNTWFPHQRYNSEIAGYLDCRIEGKAELIKISPTVMRLRKLSGQTLTFRAQGANGEGPVTSESIDLKRHGSELKNSQRWGIRMDGCAIAGNNSPPVETGAAFAVVGYGIDGVDGYYLDFVNPSGADERISAVASPNATVATARKDYSSGENAGVYYTDKNHPDLCQFFGGFASLLYQGIGAPDCNGTRVWAFSSSTYSNFYLVNCGDHFTDQNSDVFNINGGMILHCGIQSNLNLSGSFSGFEIRKSVLNKVSGNPAGITWDGNHFVNDSAIGTNGTTGTFYDTPPYPSGEMRPRTEWLDAAPDDDVYYPTKYSWGPLQLPTAGVWKDVGLNTQLEETAAEIEVAAVCPSPVASAQIDQGNVITVDAMCPTPTASATGGNVASIDSTNAVCPTATVSASAYTSGVIQVAATCPAPIATARIEQDNGMTNNVPGILYIGGFMVQGGGGAGQGLNAAYTTASGIPDTNLKYLDDRDVMRICPDITTGASAGDDASGDLQCWPWYDGRAGDTLTITASTRYTLTVSGAGWDDDEWIGRHITIADYAYLIPGTGFRWSVAITDNTSDTLTVAGWGATVGATTTVSGLRYAIVATGSTDFTAIGAADSNPGTTFTATGAGTGTGTVVEIPKPGEDFMIGQGRFDAYHAVRAWRRVSEVVAGVPSFRGGDTWQTGGLGVGPTCTMVRKLFENVYNSPPYFHLVKWGSPDKVISGWGNSPNDAARASLVAEMVRVAAAADSRGNTISWDHVIIDLSMEDVKYARTGAAEVLDVFFNYPTRLREMIAWLRSSAVMNNPTAVVTLVNHDPYMYADTPGFVQQMRTFHSDVSRTDANTRILDMAGQPFGEWDDNPDDIWTTYSQAGFMEYGRKAAEIIRVANAGLNQNISSGFPIYVMLGDSIFVGEILPAWTSNLDSPTLSVNRPAAQKVYNRGSVSLEVYVPHSNSNTSGSISEKAGPELSLMHELYELHPEGFALIKRASFGSSLKAEAAAYGTDGVSGGVWSPATVGEHWDELKRDIASCISLVQSSQNKQADLVGAFVSLGTNDCAVAGGGAQFAAELPVFCYSLWEQATRSSGPKFPIIWRRPQDDVGNIPQEEVRAVRTAIEALAANETQFEYIDVDDLERKASDNIHETPESAVIDGERLVAMLRTRSLAIS